MAKPHRATPEQWDSIERWADSSSSAACILELRARIEALEAAHQPPLFTAEEVAPTDEELYELWNSEGNEADFQDCRRFARAVLARWGTPAIEPVPVSERLPDPEDCDAEGRCWLYGKVEDDWRLLSAFNSGVPHLKYCFSHWLPHWALPVPTPAIAAELEALPND